MQVERRMEQLPASLRPVLNEVWKMDIVVR